MKSSSSLWRRPIVDNTIYFLPLRYEDWWWKVALGKCYFRLGMLRWPGVQVASCLGDQALLLGFILREVLNCKLCSSIAAFLPESFWGNAQGCGEAVQVGHKTAANDRHLSNAGQGHSICSDIFFTVVFCEGLSTAWPTPCCPGGRMGLWNTFSQFLLSL